MCGEHASFIYMYAQQLLSVSYAVGMGARIVECVASQQTTIPCTLFAQRLHLLGIIFTLKQKKQVSQWIQMKQSQEDHLAASK